MYVFQAIEDRQQNQPTHASTDLVEDPFAAGPSSNSGSPNREDYPALFPPDSPPGVKNASSVSEMEEDVEQHIPIVQKRRTVKRLLPLDIDTNAAKKPRQWVEWRDMHPVEVPPSPSPPNYEPSKWPPTMESQDDVLNSDKVDKWRENCC